MKRFVGLLLALALVVGVLFLVFFAVRGDLDRWRWRLALLGQEAALQRPAGSDETPVRILLRPGQSVASLAEELAAVGLIHSKSLFLAHLRAAGQDRHLAAGEYYLNETQNIPELAAAFSEQGSSPFPQAALDITHDGPRQRFELRAGETVAAVGQRLADAALIAAAADFERYMARNGLAPKMQAATYFFSPAQTIGEIAHRLTDAAASVIPLRLLSGMRLEEIARALDDSQNPFAFRGADFLALVGPGAVVPPEFRAFVGLPAGASLEGFFLPGNHRFSPDISALELRDWLLDEFQQRVAATTLPEEAAAQGWSLYEALTLAAIVEREALFNDEFASIAGVYRNRLQNRWRLEADPTVQYALQGLRGSWWPSITPADYSAVVSPYNTYLHLGLPPGPIASPSLAALVATLRPQTSDYFFFRARCDGSGYHTFAVTYEEHLANGC